MTLHGPLFRNDYEFQDGGSRGLSKVWGPHEREPGLRYGVGAHDNACCQHRAAGLRVCEAVGAEVNQDADSDSPSSHSLLPGTQ